MKASEQKKVIPLLRSAVSTLIGNKEILFPFTIIAFTQFLLLQVAYFAPRFPLNKVFGPLIRHYWSDQYMHFPYNFTILPRIFQNSIIQATIYMFISSFFIACAISIVQTINNGHTIKMRRIMKGNMKIYFRIVIIAALSLVSIKLLFLITGKLIERAMLIQSDSGVFLWIKQAVLTGAPYLNLLFSVLVTTLLAFLLPVVVIEKKKIFQALFTNFKMLWGSFWFTFTIILIPVLFLIPVILLRNSVSTKMFFPELTVFMLMLSALVTILIDAVVYTSITIYYLVLKDQ